MALTGRLGGVLREAKVPALVLFSVSTVWVCAWERHIDLEIKTVGYRKPPARVQTTPNEQRPVASAFDAAR